MNKAMTLEEMQDAKAYPLTYTHKHPGMTPMQMARQEMKRHKMRCGGVPKDFFGARAGLERDKRDKRLLEAMQDRHLTKNEIAAIMGMSYNTIHSDVFDAALRGVVESCGAKNGSELFRVAK